MTVDPAKLKAKARRLARIDGESCSGCEVCVDFCPVPGCILPADAPEGTPLQVLRVVEERCIGCTLCVQFCPWECITMLDPSHRNMEKHEDRYAMA